MVDCEELALAGTEEAIAPAAAGELPPTTVAAEEETLRYTLDSRSKTDWVLFDFADGSVVEGDHASPG